MLHLNPKMTIAFAHGAFNTATTILLFPFIRVLEFLVVKLIKSNKREKEYKTKLDMALLTAPVIALGQVKAEITDMTSLVLENLKASVDFFHNHNEKLAEEIETTEEGINNLDQEISNYLTLLSGGNFNVKEGEEIGIYLDMCRDVERIGDHAFGIVKDVNYEIKKK